MLCDSWTHVMINANHMTLSVCRRYLGGATITKTLSYHGGTFIMTGRPTSLPSALPDHKRVAGAVPMAGTAQDSHTDAAHLRHTIRPPH